jgi:D-serine dehydratase
VLLFAPIVEKNHPETYEDFESVASDIVEVIRMNDQRFGVEPKERVKRK